MKRSFALVMALVAAGLALWSSAARAQIPTGTTSLSFSGFCDGVTISYSGSGSFISGTHDNWNCAAGQTFIAGVAAQDLKFAPGEGSSPVTMANMADNVGALGLSNGALQLYLDFGNGTFSVYAETDSVSPEMLVNQGRFKIISAPVSSSNKLVAAWQGALQNNPTPNPGTAYPSGTYDIFLDTYCDFFHLTTAGNRVGGVHDLTTNCGLGLSNVPVAANDTSLAADVDGTAGASLATSDLNEFGDGCIFNFYFDFSGSTWTVYRACDDTGLFRINSGTFTFQQNGPLVAVPQPSRAGLPAAANP